MRRLETAREVIEAIGGAKFRRLFGKTLNDVFGYSTRNRFPPTTYDAMTRVLELLGYEAPRSLWGQVEINAHIEIRPVDEPEGAAA